MNLVSIEDAYYQAAYTGSNCLSALEAIIPLKLDRKYYLPKDLNKLSKKKFNLNISKQHFILT